MAKHPAKKAQAAEAPPAAPPAPPTANQDPPAPPAGSGAEASPPAPQAGGASGGNSAAADDGPAHAAQLEADDDAIVFGEEKVPLSLIVERVVSISGLTVEEWGGLADATRQGLIKAGLAAFEQLHQAGRAIRAQARAAVEAGAVTAITVRSRDGKPFRRAGFVFGGDWQTVEATADQIERITADPGLLVKGD